MIEFIKIAVTDLGENIISAKDVKLVKQASTTTTTIAYGSGSTATDVLTITHTALDSGVYSVRDAVQDAILACKDRKNEPSTFIDVVLPDGIAVSGVAIA